MKEQEERFRIMIGNAHIVAIAASCSCAECYICGTWNGTGCTSNLLANGEICGSITDGYGTRDKYCCEGLCLDFAFNDTNCGSCGFDCGAQYCCNGVCMASPC